MSRKWQLILKDVDKLIGSSNGSLFDRAKMLVAVWNDGDYLAHHKGDVDKAEAMLNEKLGDYGLTFFNVKDMLTHFPNRAQWEAGKLREMLANAFVAEEALRETRKAPKVERQLPVPRKEVAQPQKIVANAGARDASSRERHVSEESPEQPCEREKAIIVGDGSLSIEEQIDVVVKVVEGTIVESVPRLPAESRLHGGIGETMVEKHLRKHVSELEEIIRRRDAQIATLQSLVMSMAVKLREAFGLKR